MIKHSPGLAMVVMLSLLFGSTVFTIPPQGADRATASDALASPGDARPEGSRPGNTVTPEVTRPDATLSDATPANAMARERDWLVLDETSVIVYDYAQLKLALSGDNGYTTIYLGNDIATDASGAAIHASKTAVVIDGRPPGEEEQTYTLTQYYSTVLAYTIRIESNNKNTKEVTLRNLEIEGGNYYGIISVQAEDVLLIHDNVQYSGPQPVYNRGGTTRFVNSSYLLKTTGGAAANELAETKHAEFEGVVTVEAPATANAVLSLVSSISTLTLQEHADVTINTNYYFIYTAGYAPSVLMRAGSRLSLTSTRFGMTYADQRISTLVMAERSELLIDHKTPESYAALRISQLFQMDPDSRLTIVRTGTAGIPLRFTNTGARAVFNRPGRVFLYSSAGVPLRFTGPGTLEITTSAINVWKEIGWPPEAAADRLPDHIWNKTGTGQLSVSGSYNETLNTRLDHNITSADPVSTVLNAVNFNLEKSQLIAFGSLELTIDEVRQAGELISGETAAEAGIFAEYHTADHGMSTVSGTADQAGIYRLPVTAGAMLKDSTVQVTAVAEQLFIRQQANVTGDPGSLRLVSVPEQISFEKTMVPDRQKLIGRQGDGSFRLEIQDSREEAAPWRLDVYLEEALDLTGTVVYKDAGGVIQPVGEVPLTIYDQDNRTGGHTISWQADEGILLQVLPGNVYSGREYRAVIHWSLVDAP